MITASKYGREKVLNNTLILLVDMGSGPEKGLLLMHGAVAVSLTSESVQGASLPLEGVDNVHGGHSLPLGVLGVGDGIPDHVLEEHLQNATSLLVDQAGDTLHASATRQTSDGGLGNPLDIVPQHLTVPLRASLSQPLASFAASSHSGGSACTDTAHSQLTLYIYTRQPPHWSAITPPPLQNNFFFKFTTCTPALYLPYIHTDRQIEIEYVYMQYICSRCLYRIVRQLY